LQAGAHGRRRSFRSADLLEHGLFVSEEALDRLAEVLDEVEAIGTTCTVSGAPSM